MPFFQPLKTLTFTCAATALLTLSTPSIAQTSVQPSPATAESEMSPAVRAIKSLVEQGRFADAFNLGLKNESLSGDPLYDYYFGIAAVDSGRPSLGVVALERVLLTNPDNDLARLELARGYFVLEDYERAKESFTRLLAKQLPPPVRGSIEKYLAAIRDKDPDFHTVIRGYAEFAIGHNSKMNSSGDTLVPVPYTFSQVGVQLSPTKAASTDLSQVAAGINASGPIVSGIKYLVALDGNFRQYASIDGYDQGAVAVTGGVEFTGDRDRYRILSYYGDTYFNDDKLRDVTGVAVDWNRLITNEVMARSSLAYSQLRYDASSDRDSNLVNFGVGLSRFLGGAWRNSLDVDLSYGQERNQSNRSDLSRDIYAVRLTWNFYPAGRWRALVAGGYTNSDYKGSGSGTPSADTYKLDGFWTTELTLQYQLTRGWSVLGEYIRNQNVSDVAVYEYEQNIMLVNMRYEWK